MAIRYSELDDTLETLSAARLYELLSNPRRRYVLVALLQRAGPIAVSDLARKIADWETHEAEVSPPADRSQRIRIDLRHTQLPKLAEVDLLEFDRANDTVVPPKDGELLATVEPLLPSQSGDHR